MSPLRHLGRGHGVRKRLADDCVLAHRLERRISVDGQPEHPVDIAFDRDRQVQVLVLDQLSVRDAFTVPDTIPPLTES
jgi:hypothetical protein